jgi:hypothetical protein
MSQWRLQRSDFSTVAGAAPDSDRLPNSPLRPSAKGLLKLKRGNTVPNPSQAVALLSFRSVGRPLVHGLDAHRFVGA